MYNQPILRRTVQKKGIMITLFAHDIALYNGGLIVRVRKMCKRMAME